MGARFSGSTLKNLHPVQKNLEALRIILECFRIYAHTFGEARHNHANPHIPFPRNSRRRLSPPDRHPVAIKAVRIRVRAEGGNAEGLSPLQPPCHNRDSPQPSSMILPEKPRFMPILKSTEADPPMRVGLCANCVPIFPAEEPPYHNSRRQSRRESSHQGISMPYVCLIFDLSSTE